MNDIEWLRLGANPYIISQDATERLHRIADRLEEMERLRPNVSALCAAWAAQWAKENGLPDGHLHPTHYDILARAGARMVDFTRGKAA